MTKSKFLEKPQEMSIERARELLGDTAVGRSNEEVTAIVEHAKQMADDIDIYLDRRPRKPIDKTKAAADESSI